MERQHISRSYMGYLICHHSGSLPCRYVGIPTAVVSGLTLNMAFSIYLPYRFSAIYFSAMWTATAPSATALAVGQLALDGGGYIVAGETTETSIPGVYAVGDVRTKPLRQVVTAVADGAVAVHMAEKYIAENR